MSQQKSNEGKQLVMEKMKNRQTLLQFAAQQHYADREVHFCDRYAELGIDKFHNMTSYCCENVYDINNEEELETSYFLMELYNVDQYIPADKIVTIYNYAPPVDELKNAITSCIKLGTCNSSYSSEVYNLFKIVRGKNNIGILCTQCLKCIKSQLCKKYNGILHVYEACVDAPGHIHCQYCFCPVEECSYDPGFTYKKTYVCV